MRQLCGFEFSDAIAIDKRGNDPHRDYFALGAAAVTAGLHILLKGTAAAPFYIIFACAFWLAFVLWHARRRPDALRRWGFRADNLCEASRTPLILFVVSAAVFASIGVAQGTFSVPVQLPALLLLYPVWGVAQQFLVMGIVVGNLESIAGFDRHRFVLIAFGSAIFGAVHLPSFPLVIGTTALAALYVPLYLRYRNLWPLGVVHGWIGSLFYLWVLGVNPWMETFA